MSGYPKFPITPNYPKNFGRSLLAADQSPVPSQQGPVIDTFYPSGPIDLTAPTGSATGNAVPDNLAVVRAVFDSLPPYAYEFTFRDKFVSSAPVFGGFAVPAGYTAILRELSIQLFGNKGVGGNGLISPYGDISNQLLIPQTSLIINGGQQAQWTIPLSSNSPLDNPIAGFAGLLMEDAYTSQANIKTFVVLPNGSICNILIPGWTDTFNMDVLVEYSGVLLLSDGRLPQNQVGNADPEPVRNA